MSDSEQSTPVFQVKVAGKLLKHCQEAIEPYAEQMFQQTAGEWVAVVRLLHDERGEKTRRDGDYDYKVKTTVLTIVDLEVIPEPDAHSARALLAKTRDRRRANAESEALHAEGGLFANGAP